MQRERGMRELPIETNGYPYVPGPSIPSRWPAERDRYMPVLLGLWVESPGVDCPRPESNQIDPLPIKAWARAVMSWLSGRMVFIWNFPFMEMLGRELAVKINVWIFRILDSLKSRTGTMYMSEFNCHCLMVSVMILATCPDHGMFPFRYFSQIWMVP